MKLAFAGKGGTGKTSLAAWMGDYLARAGHNVWLVDADTALSLGAASGLAPELGPVPLVQREDLILKHIGTGLISLNPQVGSLPEELAVDLPPSGAPLLGGVGRAGRKRLLVMGNIAMAGGGCACEANALLKAILAHLVYQSQDYLLVDMEAGVEHLGRGTVAAVDGLIVLSEPSLRSLNTAAEVCRLAAGLGLQRQVLALNRMPEGDASLPEVPGLPASRVRLPQLPGLQQRMLHNASVLNLPEQDVVDQAVRDILQAMG